MSYASMGDLSPADWNSSKYPGVCKPTNFTSLAAFKDLQTQLNRLAQAQGLSKIPVDGDIGPATLKLISQLKPFPFASFMSPAATCATVAANATNITTVAKTTADAASVPATVSQPAPSKPITIITPAGQEVTAPASMQQAGIMGMFPGLDSPLLLLLGGGLLFYLLTERGKRGARGATGKAGRRGASSSRRSRRSSSARRYSKRRRRSATSRRRSVRRTRSSRRRRTRSR
jgi:hypothetical protein